MQKIEAELTMIFVMGGISKEKKKPYLQVSNGIETGFVTLPKNMPIEDDFLSKYERGDEITFVAELFPLSPVIRYIEGL